MRRAAPLLAALLFFPLGQATAEEKAQPYWVGKKFPSLSAPDDHWIVRRLRPAEYQGKYLWVEIGFLG